MIASLSLALYMAALTVARPTLVARAPLAQRTVTSLDQAAFQEAQQRDNTATRAFSAAEIQTSDGKCFFVDELSGDFRANLTPVQIVDCDGSDGTKWDVITAGKHNNVPGQALISSTLTNAVLNFDSRRAAGNQVILFSAGGRADGGGQVTDSQLFAFDGSAGPLTLVPKNSPRTCMTVKGNLLDQATCNNGTTQLFNIVVRGAGSSTATAAASQATASSTQAEVVSTSTEDCTTEITSTITVTASASDSSVTDCSAFTTTVTATETVTVTAGAQGSASTIGATSTVESSSAQTTTSVSKASQTATTTIANDNAAVSSTVPSGTVPVSRAGGILNPTAAAEANKRDDTATRAFSSVSLKASNGQCLFVDPQAGDFRLNLIPIAVKDCDGSANEKWDIITKGAHNNVANSALIVNTVTQGCLNFDPRRPAGDTVIMFSCGGRADGGGQTTDSQLFPFTSGNTILLAPENQKNATCLVPKGNLLDQAACTGGADQLFTIVQ